MSGGKGLGLTAQPLIIDMMRQSARKEGSNA